MNEPSFTIMMVTADLVIYIALFLLITSCRTGKSCRGHLVVARCLPGDVVNALHRSVTSQVLSAGLAEFNKEIEPAPMHVVQHLVHGAIRSKVGLNDRVECTLGSRDDWSR